MELIEALEIAEEACRNWSIKEDDEYSQASGVLRKFIDSGAASAIEQLQADKTELVELLRSVASGRQYDNSNLARFIAKHTGGRG